MNGHPVALLCFVLLCCNTAMAAANAPAAITASVEVPEPRSGYRYQTADTQGLQEDDFSNPGMLAVDLGRMLYESGPKRCANCHGSAETLADIATQYPKLEPKLGHLLNLEQRINLCRIEHQGAAPWPYESRKLLAMTAFIAHQARDKHFNPVVTGAAEPFFTVGKRYFYQRRGQLNLSCAHCHERSAGLKLRGDRLSQGHSNGYPIYRLDWQAVGSLHRRIRLCNEGVRANQLPYGDERYVALELYLAWRARTLPLETPAVRR